MAGTLYVVNGRDERLVFDPDRLAFTAEAAPGEGYSTIVVKPKAEPMPPQESIKTKGSLPPKPIDIEMTFVDQLPTELEAHRVWLPNGSTALDVASLKGSVGLDHLKTWARDIPDGEQRVLVLETDHGC